MGEGERWGEGREKEKRGERERGGGDGESENVYRNKIIPYSPSISHYYLLFTSIYLPEHSLQTSKSIIPKNLSFFLFLPLWFSCKRRVAKEDSMEGRIEGEGTTREGNEEGRSKVDEEE